MKAIRYHRFGPPEVLAIEEVKDLRIKQDQLLIEVYSTTVNSGDCHLRSGRPFMARIFAGPFVPRQKILGTSYSGKVVQVGAGISKFKVGDDVFGSLGLKSGTHAEYIKIGERGVIQIKPTHLTHEEAASIVFGSLSGKYFLDKAGLRKKQRVLIIGAAGGVGSYAVQYAAAMGASVTGVCHEKSQTFVKSLGAIKTIDYKAEKLDDYKNQFDIIFDMVGKEDLSVINSCLAIDGVYITTVVRTDVMIKQTFNKNRNKKYMFDIDKSTASDLKNILLLISKNLYRPLIDKVYGMHEVNKAHTHVETIRKSGTVVLNIKS